MKGMKQGISFFAITEQNYYLCTGKTKSFHCWVTSAAFVDIMSISQALHLTRRRA